MEIIVRELNKSLPVCFQKFFQLRAFLFFIVHIFIDPFQTCHPMYIPYLYIHTHIDTFYCVLWFAASFMTDVDVFLCFSVLCRADVRSLASIKVHHSRMENGPACDSDSCSADGNKFIFPIQRAANKVSRSGWKSAAAESKLLFPVWLSGLNLLPGFVCSSHPN